MSRSVQKFMHASRRGAWLAHLWLCATPVLGCGRDPAASTSDTAPGSTGTMTDGSTGAPTGTSEPPTTGEPCPAGALGCACLSGQVCEGMLECVADVCVEPTPGACGDGVLDRGEACDAGPENGPGKACKADCTVNICGDGDVGPGELCDDGDAIDDDECSNACTLASCGDGVTQQGEACDDANTVDTDACTSSCTLAECGDGFTQPVAGEQCDAGSDNGPGKACKLDCTLNVCGDGDGGPGEQCDEGDVIGGDGCSATCTVEACGNGVVDDGEECDEGDLEPGDGCSAACTMEGCGDGVLQPGEECDDGNLADGDGCEASCTWTPCAFLWQKTLTVPDVTRQGNAVATDASGNIAVVATLLPGTLEERMLALKLDPAGTLLWTEEAIDLRMTGDGVTVTPDGAIIAIGVEYQGGFAHDLTRRFEPGGALGWLATQVIASPTHGYGVAMTPDGAVIIAGYRQLQDSHIPWIARLDADTGAAAWTHLALPPGSMYAYHSSVAVDAAGSIYTTGSVQLAETHLMLRKFTPAGVLQWMVTVDNPDFGFAEGRDIKAISGGGVAVTGRFFYGDGDGGKTGADLWVGVFDGDGGLTWSDVHDGGPGQSYDEGKGVAVSPNGHVHVAGTVNPDSYRGIYRKYDAAGALLCSVVVDPVPPDSARLEGATVDPDGFPILTGSSGSSIYVAKMTP